MIYTLFFAILTSLLLGYLAGAFVMAYRLIKDFVAFELTGEMSSRLRVLNSAVDKLVEQAREAE